VYAPNAFTPDGDGINERFRPIIMDQEEQLYRLSIFDRWGEQIWTSTNPDEGWDGTMGGEVIKTDIYVWKLETRDLFERINHEYIGHVSLLK
jgi:gliding motility-associated-like protein